MSQLKFKKRRARSNEAKQLRSAHILRKCRELIDRGGSDWTMDELAVFSRLAKGTLYLYYKNKQQVLDALAEEALNLWLTNIANSKGEISLCIAKAFEAAFTITAPPLKAPRQVVEKLAIIVGTEERALQTYALLLGLYLSAQLDLATPALRALLSSEALSAQPSTEALRVQPSTDAQQAKAGVQYHFLGSY